MTFKDAAKRHINSQIDEIHTSVKSLGELKVNTICIDCMCDLYRLACKEYMSWEAMACDLISSYIQVGSDQVTPGFNFLLVLCADIYEGSPSVQRSLTWGEREENKSRKLDNSGLDRSSVSLSPDDYPVPPRDGGNLILVDGWKKKVLLPMLGKGLVQHITKVNLPWLTVVLRGFTPNEVDPHRLISYVHALGRVNAICPGRGVVRVDVFDMEIPITTPEADNVSVAIGGYLCERRPQFYEKLGQPGINEAAKVACLARDGDIHYVSLCYSHGRKIENLWVCHLPRDAWGHQLKTVQAYNPKDLNAYLGRKYGNPFSYLLALLAAGSDYSFSISYLTPSTLLEGLQAFPATPERMRGVFRRHGIHALIEMAKDEELGWLVKMERKGPEISVFGLLGWVLVSWPEVQVKQCSCSNIKPGPCTWKSPPRRKPKDITLHHLLSFVKALKAAFLYFYTESDIERKEDYFGFEEHSYCYDETRRCYIYGVISPGSGPGYGK